MIRLHQKANGTFEPAPVRAALAAHAVPGGQRYEPASGDYTRLVPVGGQILPVTVRPVEDGVEVTSEAAGPEACRSLTGLVRYWFDLDTDLDPVTRRLAADPALAPMIRARPGLRVTRAPDGYEAAVSTVLGQQVSVARGRILGARLLELCGSPGPAGLTAFPAPERLAEEPFERLRESVGLTRSRARTVLTVAALFADGFRFGPQVDPQAARRQLLAVSGVGPWTVDYLAIRAVGDPDAFPAGDAVLRRAFGGEPERDLAARAERWSPWRSYAAVHLWAATVYADPPSGLPAAAARAEVRRPASGSPQT